LHCSYLFGGVCADQGGQPGRLLFRNVVGAVIDHYHAKIRASMSTHRLRNPWYEFREGILRAGAEDNREIDRRSIRGPRFTASSCATACCANPKATARRAALSLSLRFAVMSISFISAHASRMLQAVLPIPAPLPIGSNRSFKVSSVRLVLICQIVVQDIAKWTDLAE
jgi:hypothetical protein